MSQQKLGNRIQCFRERLGLSPEELAAKAGVSVATIMAIESGEADPILGVRIKLARALGQRLGTFMDDISSPDPVVVRAEDRQPVAQPTHTQADACKPAVCYFSLGKGKTNRAMEPFFIEFAVCEPADLSSHEGEEFIVCVSGTVAIEHGGKSFELKPGDSIYYDAVVPHRVFAQGDKPASIYAVVFVPA